MTEIIVKQMPAFKRHYKKMHKAHQEKVKLAIEGIIQDPKIGQEKKGDLAGVFIYKFKISAQQFLLAYEWDPKTRILLALGVHENFYRDLKKR